MKALRNARSRLIPEEIRTKIITLAKQKGKVKTLPKNDPEGPKSPRESKNSPKASPDKPMSDKQRKKLWAMMMEKKLTKDEAKGFFDYVNPESSADASDFIENFKTKYQEWLESMDGKVQDAPPDSYPCLFGDKYVTIEDCQQCDNQECPKFIG